MTCAESLGSQLTSVRPQVSHNYGDCMSNIFKIIIIGLTLLTIAIIFFVGVAYYAVSKL